MSLWTWKPIQETDPGSIPLILTRVILYLAMAGWLTSVYKTVPLPESLLQIARMSLCPACCADFFHTSTHSCAWFNQRPM